MKLLDTKLNTNKGLTLIEVIVVAGIISVLIGATVANYREFDRTNVLGNLAQDIALSVRLAQSYGLNVRGNPFDSSYGISFSDADPTSYFIYRDSNRGVGGFEYDILDGGVKLETYDLGQGYIISDVCVNNGGDICFSGGAINRLDITFDRPKPDANFRTDDGNTTYNYADISIQNPKGATQTIRVRVTGYINIE